MKKKKIIMILSAAVSLLVCTACQKQIEEAAPMDVETVSEVETVQEDSIEEKIEKVTEQEEEIEEEVEPEEEIEEEEPPIQRVERENTSEVGRHETENTNYALYPSTIVESDPKNKPSQFIPWETTIELTFPQIYYSNEYGDYQNSNIETAINQELFNAIGYADCLSDRDTRLLREIMMDYEISKADDELISIKYYGTVLDVWHEHDICYGITIDIQTGEKVALSELITLEDNLVERVENGEIEISSLYDWEFPVGYIEELYEDYQKGLLDEYTCYYLEEDAVNLVINIMGGNNTYFILRIPLEAE
ncbi:MAG: hypothetical protein HDR30_09685 [Lachnospiraceae bacterium]|nr:hypothetical protein [Lachnospiraceae bacterium]